MVTMIFWSTLSRGKKMNVLFLVVTAMLPIICKGRSKAHDTVIEKKGNSAVLPSNFTYEPLAKGEKINIIWLKNHHNLKRAEIVLNCSANRRTCNKNKDNRFQLIGNVFDQNGSVLLKDLQLSDTGSYYYRLEFPDSTLTSWTFIEPTNLTVQGSPEILLDVIYWFFKPTKDVDSSPIPLYFLYSRIC
ncbi:sialoadhesin-like [Erpetoichthys calabaricus]|uniref:sialoadhesin-like n=1 Tax=Erpetoichthys calabaricus TaxID=27687 RepID=UPI002233F48E|nr:sialoadhesin-like [Erpetoichthys calabaricus]